MENTYSKIQELLHQKADYQARLNLIPYEGTPEIKDRDVTYYIISNIILIFKHIFVYIKSKQSIL